MFESSLNNPFNFLPDYNSGVSVSASSVQNGYTAPYNGIIYITYLPSNNNGELLYINGVQIGKSRYITGYSVFPIPYILNKGDIIKISVSGSAEVYDGKFYPCKGVN